MEFDTDCVEYDLEYLRVVRRGTVRCCGGGMVLRGAGRA